MAIPYTFTCGTLIKSDEVNCNFLSSVLTDGSQPSDIYSFCLSGSAPAGNEGEMYYNCVEQKIYFHDGSNWNEVGSGAGGIGRYAENFSSQTTFTVTHNLGDMNPVVQVYDSLGEQVTPDKIDVTGGNTVLIEFNASTSGFVVVQGGQGIDLGTTAYYDQAFTSSSAVAVSHGLGQKYVHVSVYDNTSNLIEPQQVVLVDDNNLCVCFGSAETGCVVVSGGTTEVNVIGVKRYSECVTGADNYLVAHNLNTFSPDVTVYDDSTSAIIYPDVSVVNENCVCIELASTTTICAEIQGGFQTATCGAGTGDLLPCLTNTYDFGSATYMWKDGYFAGKLTVCGGIDPEYLQLTPQVGSGNIPINSMYINSGNGVAMMKDCSGSVVTLAQGGGGVGVSDLDELRSTVLENSMGVTILAYEAAVEDIPHEFLIVDMFSDANGYNDTLCVSPRQDYTLTPCTGTQATIYCCEQCWQFGCGDYTFTNTCVFQCLYNDGSTSPYAYFTTSTNNCADAIDMNSHCYLAISFEGSHCLDSVGTYCCYGLREAKGQVSLLLYENGTYCGQAYVWCWNCAISNLPPIEITCSACIEFVKVDNKLFNIYADGVCTGQFKGECVVINTQFCHEASCCNADCGLVTSVVCYNCVGIYDGDVIGDFTSAYNCVPDLSYGNYTRVGRVNTQIKYGECCFRCGCPAGTCAADCPDALYACATFSDTCQHVQIQSLINVCGYNGSFINTYCYIEGCSTDLVNLNCYCAFELCVCSCVFTCNTLHETGIGYVYWCLPFSDPACCVWGNFSACCNCLTCYCLVKKATDVFDVYCYDDIAVAWCYHSCYQCGDFCWNSCLKAVMTDKGSSGFNNPYGRAVIQWFPKGISYEDKHLYTCLHSFDAPVCTTYLKMTCCVYDGAVTYDVFDCDYNNIGCDLLPNTIQALTNQTHCCIRVKLKMNDGGDPSTGDVTLRSYALAVDTV